jgi:hypothetical protein
MNLERMRKVVAALDVAERGGQIKSGGYFCMEHDILYLPWFEQIGIIAEMLKAAGCHWDEDADSWASF